jgi:hypothetical protein
VESIYFDEARSHLEKLNFRLEQIERCPSGVRVDGDRTAEEQDAQGHD